MNLEEQKIFNLFKTLIITKYLKDNSGHKDVKKWSGEDITAFQEDLFEKVNTKVSEKWFYSYFKNEPEKLPRIDMLNILSKYIGYKNWTEFRNSNAEKKSKKFWWFFILVVPIFIYTILISGENEYHFCFYDEDKNEKITVPVAIKILKNNETPLFFTSDKNGCFEYNTHNDYIKLVISSSYYKTDTIVRKANNSKSSIYLNTDDYALMLDYYTNSKLKNWEDRKKELEKLIDDKAIIYQLFSRNIGVEIYDKNEFINLLTIPTTSLKKIKILSKDFKNGKIVKLKFILQ